MDVFGLKEEDGVPGEQGNSTLKGAGNIPYMFGPWLHDSITQVLHSHDQNLLTPPHP